MSGYGENNIRKILKGVYDLYTDVWNLTFTTYNFEPDFFEEHVITYLMGSDKKINTIGELNETNKWIKDHDVSVYYDKGALISGSSCVTLPVYPQHIRTGVFHPKVIVIYGKLQNGNKAAHIIVSSCNLTVSGYGRNQEAFSCIQVKSEQVAKSLLAFIDKLCDGDSDRHRSLRDFLRDEKFNTTENVEFFWNYGNTGETLISRISKLPAGKLTIVSPYFDEDGPESLLNEIAEKEVIQIFPSIDGEKYNIHRSDYQKLVNAGVKFGELEKNIGADGSKRFIHAKLISKGNYVCVGSYNFTSAAMRQKNAEAALIFKCDEEPTYTSCDINETLLLDDDEEIVNRDEIEISHEQIFVSVTIDWAEDKLFVHAELPDDTFKYYLQIDGIQGGTNNQGWKIKDTSDAEDISINLDNATIKALLRHKQFSVYKDNTICFKGLINELNWVGVRPEIGCESLDETIAEWFQHSEKKASGHVYDLRYITEEDTITEQLIGGSTDPQIDIFDNYYLVSRALGFLLDEIENSVETEQKKCLVTRKTKKYREWKDAVLKAEETLYGILFARPGSMTQILKFVEKDEQDCDKKQDIVYAWLICKYLKEALRLMPKKIGQTRLLDENNQVYKNKVILYEEKRKNFTSLINKAEKRFRGKIATEVSDEYIRWIDKELFKREVK